MIDGTPGRCADCGRYVQERKVWVPCAPARPRGLCEDCWARQDRACKAWARAAAGGVMERFREWERSE